METLKRFMSRKFLTSFGAEASGLFVALGGSPSIGDAFADAIVRIGGLVTRVIVALGYGMIEASIDKADATRE